ncbi:MAG: hypothetical protein GOMPHAMPRED_006142 [Gomphillus americanus]|uniref:Topoisomerase 6 subunit A/Spo11 TOPRIM domain-containing protein n=1 Tax=Gomphillus americanus TaxID=1940652 RepID=A0A8H3EPY8_9LECA|nr:MAG: hypothetical protein GOMPHAMPRED_006142 [Gomphillus americanus]
MDQVLIPSSSKRDQVIVQIEALICTMLQDLDDERPLVLPLRTTGSSPSKDTSPNLNNYCFPGISHSPAWRFTIVLRILDIIHEALIDDLFGSQSTINRHVDNIALTFNVSVKDLNVIAEVKGLIAGPLLVRKGESLLDDSIYINPEVWYTCSQATFHALSQSNFHTRNSYVLLTGQGYPDLATRAFLHYFNNHLASNIPCYALVDFDPDGLCIYSVYTRGSQASSNQLDTVVPNLRLLGLRSETAMPLLGIEMAVTDSQTGRDNTVTDAIAPNNAIELSYLSQHERQRAKGLLKRLRGEIEFGETDEAEQRYMQERWDWQGAQLQACPRQQTEVLIRELQICLIMGYKVEMEILNNRAGGLEKWVLETVEEQANRA